MVMNGVLDLKSENFLFGNNVHHVLIIGGIAFLIYLELKEQKKGK